MIHGDPKRLLYPTDSQKRICGVKTSTYDFQDRPYLFFFDLTQCINLAQDAIDGCPTTQVCVKACPSSYYFQLQVTQGLPGSMSPADLAQFCTDTDVQGRNVASMLQVGMNGIFFINSSPYTPTMYVLCAYRVDLHSLQYASYRSVTFLMYLVKYVVIFKFF